MDNFNTAGNNYTYTPMLFEHYESAYKLWENTDELRLTIGDSPDSIKKYLNRNLGMSFVCIETITGNLIGTVLGGHDGRRGFIYHLAVDINFRNNSIGKSLVEHCINAIKNDGIERCILMVKTGNEKAGSFWKKLGWKKRDDLEMYSNNLNR